MNKRRHIVRDAMSVMLAAILVITISPLSSLAFATDSSGNQENSTVAVEEADKGELNQKSEDESIPDASYDQNRESDSSFSDKSASENQLKTDQLSGKDDEGDIAPSENAPSVVDEKTREAETFDANAYVSQLNLTLSSGGVTKTYAASGSEEIDTTPDFPDGLERKASYVANITLDTKSMLDAQGKYPFVAGDKITCRVPDIINVGGTTTGRLRDSTADWDGAHDGVGTYEVVKGADGHNVMTITYDDGYVAEKSGKILSSAVKLSGGFDLTGQSNESFDTTLVFGALNVKTKFSKLEIIRNLSIEKTGAVENWGPSVSNSSPYYPRKGSASLDSEGYLTYTVTAKAGEDNTYKLTNVKVTDLFDEASPGKVDLSTMKLVSVVNDGRDTTTSATELRADDGTINGWNIGDLGIGTSATVTFKVKLNKDVVTAAVDAAKAADPSSDASDARTLKNTATASADETVPVSDDYTTILNNYVTVSKRATTYDASTQTQHFTITVKAPSDNRYTQHDVPIYDYLYDGYLDARYYAESGIASMTVRHADGTTGPLSWDNFKQQNSAGNADSRSWYATISELRPGDEVTIDSYLTVNDSYWTNSAGAGLVGNGNTTRNQVYVGNVGSNGYYSSDLNKAYGYDWFKIVKTVLSKNNPNINSDGTIDWFIKGNERGKSATPTNVAGLVLNDVLGSNQEFMGGAASVVFYNQDGSVAGRDSIQLAAGSTSFSYTIPDQYGTCEYQISYRSKITDWESYVGPAKSYTNTVNGVTGTTAERQRVAAMSKKFVQQADDWSQWQTSIYSELENGDTYVDTSRSGITYMYFTQQDLDGITLTIDGIAVDESLYEIAPVQAGSSDGKYASYQITFKGKVMVNNGGVEVTPSVDHPLVIAYKAHMVNPSMGGSYRDYCNDATLTAGGAADNDNDYCRRNNGKEIVKQVESSGNGYITWRVKTNYYGYSGQPDGACVVTDTLPAGLTYVDCVKAQGQGQIDSVTPVVNDDGTTTLTIKLSGLGHDEVCKDNPNDNNGSKEFHFLIKTKITDPEYLYGTESRDFTYTNNVSLNDRYGNLKQASATATIKHVAMSKTMVYNEVTAPYAQFSIEANQDRLDLNPDGDTVGVTDVSSKTLSIDLNSINVVDARTGLPVNFTVDASQMGNNEFTVRVPDNTHVKITYQAQVLGYVGQNVQADNSAFYEGHRTTSGESSISKLVTVLNASGHAVSEPMVRLSKRDEAASALGGATYRLDIYDEATGQWETIRDGIATTDDNSVKGVKVESLELDKLYRFVETHAPAGYVLDATPHYFVLFGDAAPTVSYPADVDPADVFQGPSGSVITAYDQPYTPVRFTKTSDDGVQLAGAEFSVYAVDAQGNVSDTPAIDEQGSAVTFTSSADAVNEFSLAPGTYQLKETKAPAGYKASDPVIFVVKGDAARTVLVGDQTVQSGKGDVVQGAVNVTDYSSKTNLSVTKAWDDCSNYEGIRPQSVMVQLVADGTAVDGKTAELTANNDWSASFDGLDVMKEGKAISYTVKEIDPGTGDVVESGSTLTNGYTVSGGSASGSAATAASDGYSAVLTNSYSPKATNVSVSKVWVDGNNVDGKRPESVVVELYRNGEYVGYQTMKADGNWSTTFENLPKVDADGNEYTYTVKERALDGYIAEVSGTAAAGFVVTNVQATSVAVSKVWNDNDNAAGIRPNSVTVNLLRDGEKVDSAVIEAGDDGSWSYTFEGLAKYDSADGHEYVYNVEEAEVPEGYESTIEGDVTHGFVVTNTKQENPPVPEGANEGETSEGHSSESAKTGDAAGAAAAAALAVLAGAACATCFARRKMTE